MLKTYVLGIYCLATALGVCIGPTISQLLTLTQTGTSVPVVTTAPVVTGTAQVGQVLTTTTGTWTNTPTAFQIQWSGNIEGTITGATSTTYTPVESDVGNILTATVTATNSAGPSVPSASNQTAAVIDVIPTNVSPPAIAGIAQVGQTLTTTPGVWTSLPSSFGYTWSRSNGTPTTAFTATPSASSTGNQGFQLRELIPSSSLSGVSGTIPGSIRVKFNFTASTSAGTLNAYIGEAPASPTHAWDFDGTQFHLTFNGVTPLTAITGAQTVTSDWVPFTITGTKNLVIAAFYGGTTVNLGSVVSAPINVYNSNTVVDPSATSPAGLATVSGTVIGAVEVDFVPTSSATLIGGATNPTYVPVAGDVGFPLFVSDRATNTGGTSAYVNSITTNSIIAASGAAVPVNTVAPSVSGTPQVGQTLTATNGTWTNSPTGFSYQWSGSGNGSSAPFTISSGKIIDPNGRTFVPKGINIYAFDLPEALTPPGTTPITSTFPGINFVRIIYSNPADMSPAILYTYVQALTSQGVVVEIVDFTPNACVLTGAALTTSVNNITTYATQFKNNPFVWFGTQDSPGLFNLGAGPTCTNGTVNLAPITAEQVAYYNGVRGAGNNSIVVLHSSGNPMNEVYNSGNLPNFASMTRVIWGLPYYNWMSNFATDTATNLAQLATNTAIFTAITTASGVPPVETTNYGNSTDGSTDDPGFSATLTAVNTTPSGGGSAVWNWCANSSKNQVFNGGVQSCSPFTPANLCTDEGLPVASFISAGPSPPIPPGTAVAGPIIGATAQTYVPKTSDIGQTLTVAVLASNGAGPALSAASSAPTAAIVSSTATGPVASRTFDLMNIIGVSGHAAQYGTNPSTVADASYLGIHKWRDSASPAADGQAFFPPNVQTTYQNLVNAGINIIGSAAAAFGASLPASTVTTAKIIAGMGTGSLVALEQPNEPSNFPFTYNGHTVSATQPPGWNAESDFSRDFYAAVKADSVIGTTGQNIPVWTSPLIGAEVGNWGMSYLTVPAGPPPGVLAAANEVYADAFNSHIYPPFGGAMQTVDPVKGDYFNNQATFDYVLTGNGFAGYATLAAMRAAGTYNVTEFGYTTLNPGPGGIAVNEPTKGKLLLNGIMNAWFTNIKNICINVFYPSQPTDDGYSLFTGPAAPKTSAVWLHNYTTIMNDPGATAKTFATGSLAYTLSGLPTTGRSMLFEKSNGTYELILWNNVTSWNLAAGTPITTNPTPVVVTFAASGTMNIYDPTVGISNISTIHGLSTTAQLSDGPLVVEFVPDP
jgi:hypothetical protein